MQLKLIFEFLRMFQAKRCILNTKVKNAPSAIFAKNTMRLRKSQVSTSKKGLESPKKPKNRGEIAKIASDIVF